MSRQLPEGWNEAVLEDLVSTIAPPARVPKDQFGKVGKYPIIDQSKEEVAGWTDDPDILVNPDKPVVVFGDHTCAVKYVDRPFAQGADGIKILLTHESLLPKYLYFALSANPLESKGYKRHFATLRKISIPLPPLAEQKRIAGIIQEWQEANSTAISKAEAMISAKQRHFNGLLKQLIRGPAGSKQTAMLGDLPASEIIVEKGKPLKKSQTTQGDIPVIAGGQSSPYSHNAATHEQDCVTVSSSGAYAGYVRLHTEPIWASDCSVVYSNKHSTEYLYYALKAHQDRLYASQSGSGQPHVYPKDLKWLSIHLPTLSEQKRIVGILNAAQSTVESQTKILQKMVQKYQALRHGFMQNLLSGKWRVPA